MGSGPETVRRASARLSRALSAGRVLFLIFQPPASPVLHRRWGNHSFHGRRDFFQCIPPKSTPRFLTATTIAHAGLRHPAAQARRPIPTPAPAPAARTMPTTTAPTSPPACSTMTRSGLQPTRCMNPMRRVNVRALHRSGQDGQPLGEGRALGRPSRTREDRYPNGGARGRGRFG